MRILSLLYMCFVVLESKDLLLPAPANISLKSQNFNIVLYWSPGKDTPLGTVYNVQIGKKLLQNITGTDINISKYVEEIFQNYIVEIWALKDNISSSKKTIKFSPFEITVIGPPSFSLSGCGDCLNISISLPKPKYITNEEYRSFYNNINFDIHWRKAADEKDGCNNLGSKYHKIQVQSYTHVLQYLQRGERYCVQVQPQSSSITNIQASCWVCEFTSIKEPSGVGFLAGWVGGFVTLGLCLLFLAIIVIYTGFLCKPNRRVPKALSQVSLVPVYIHDLENVCLSTAYMECNLKKNQAKDLQQCASGGDDNNDENYEEEDEEDEEDESHQGYMDRAANGSEEEAESGSSVILSEGEKIYGNCSPQDTQAPTELQEPVVSSYFQNSLDKYETNRTVCSVPVSGNVHPPESKRQENTVDQKRESNHGGFQDVSLWSVTLKSMQHKDEQMDEKDESREPLLSSLLKELHDDAFTSMPRAECSSLSEPPTNCLLWRDSHAESQNGHDEHDDFSHTHVRDHTRTEYMATHTGIIDTESDSSEEDEEENTSGYMTR